MALERVPGRTDARMVAEDLAGPLGLAHTGAETDSRSVQGYVAGTEAAGPISLTQPFAAGCMVSTVDDLAAWTLALHGGKVLRPASLKLMLSPGRTPDGKAAVYGMGLGLKEAQGRMTIGHAGAIAVGAVACGLHQIVFHPLFVAPFILHLWFHKRRALALG